MRCILFCRASSNARSIVSCLLRNVAIRRRSKRCGGRCLKPSGSRLTSLSKPRDLFNSSDAGLGRIAVEAIEAALQGSAYANGMSPRVRCSKNMGALKRCRRAINWSASKRGCKLRLPTGAIRAGVIARGGNDLPAAATVGKVESVSVGESGGADRDAATLLALARLADAIGDEREAASYFKEAAVEFATRPISRRPILRLPFGVLRSADPLA